MKIVTILITLLCHTRLFAATYGLEMVLQDKIFTASKIEFEFEKWLDANGQVSSPAATWIQLLTIYSRGEKYCLFFRSQYENLEGVLRLSAGAACESNYEKPEYSADRIHSFNLKFDRSEHALVMNLTMGKSEKSEETFKFYFPSYQGKLENLKVLSDSSPSGSFSYLSLSPKTEEKIQLLGKYSDNYRDSSATICHKVSSKCADEVPNHCDQCAFGYYEVVDHLCPQGGSKFCGVNRCGEQGQPACPRGELAAGRTLKAGEVLDWCSKDSTAGFCQNGLTPTCDGNKILVCL